MQDYDAKRKKVWRIKVKEIKSEKESIKLFRCKQCNAISNWSGNGVCGVCKIKNR